MALLAIFGATVLWNFFGRETFEPVFPEFDFNFVKTDLVVDLIIAPKLDNFP